MSHESLVWFWNQAGGKYHPFAQPAGICLAMCQFWLTQRMRGLGGDELMNRIKDSEVLGRISARQDQIDGREHKIPGMHKEVVAAKNMGSGTLRGREELLSIILSTRGTYIYSVKDDRLVNGYGHAIAFDTYPPDLYFFDPNFGQAWFEGCNADKDHAFRVWFYDFWDDAMWVAGSYKDVFRRGDKALRRYTFKDCSSLMT